MKFVLVSGSYVFFAIDVIRFLSQIKPGNGILSFRVPFCFRSVWAMCTTKVSATLVAFIIISPLTLSYEICNFTLALRGLETHMKIIWNNKQFWNAVKYGRSNFSVVEGLSNVLAVIRGFTRNKILIYSAVLTLVSTKSTETSSSGKHLNAYHGQIYKAWYRPIFHNNELF